MVNRIVRCPHCGKFRRTNASKTVKCFSCGKTFKVADNIVSESFYAKQVSKKIGFE
ncbi:MAG: hypothetical protein M1433_02875 [Candidatus Parvarchaeota archaeon]|nr:hypothetical protein [Candidatus Parvarchaeota archaeon]